MMATQERLDIPELLTHLRRAFRHGARAPQLVAYAPGLIDLLCPDHEDDPSSIYERAVQAEQAISEAVKTMDAPRDTAMEILMCLRPGTLGVKLDERRQHAARLFKVSADTFRRRERHEPMLVLDLALTLYRRHQTA
jgi:hypothetical protein